MSDQRAHSRSRGFMFEEMWIKHESYDDMILDAWERTESNNVSLRGLWQHLRQVLGQMKKWSYDTFGSVRQELKKLRAELEEAKSRAITSNSSLEVREVERKLHDMYDKEETMYRQRSRIEWLKAGDRNTKFFQNRATHRRRKNTIKFLKKEDGSRCETDEGMRDLARSFYGNLYSSEGADHLDRILDQIGTFVSPEMNAKLSESVSDKEIEMALFHMGPTKSPGLDGLPTLFY